MRSVLISGAILTAAVLAGCGDTDGGSAEPAPSVGSGGTVEVVAKDVEFPEHSYETTAGEVSFRYVNAGAIAHTLLIEGVDGFKLEVGAKGDEDRGATELEPGTYVLYCDVPGHRDAGMEATLEVS